MVKISELISRVSIFRIGIVAAVTFAMLAYAFDHWAPEPAPARSNVELMGMSSADPLVVRRNVRKSPDEFLVAMITDSSIQILEPDPTNIQRYTRRDFVPDMLIREIPEVDGRKLRIAVFTQQFGQRSIDKYYQANYALSLKPDLLIYTINPTFDFTPRWIMGGAHIPGALATYGDSASWRWSLFLSSPAELLQGVLIRILPAVGRRVEYGSAFAGVADKLDVFNLGEAPKPPTKAGWPILQHIAQRDGRAPRWDPSKIPSSQFIHLMGMRYMDTRPNGWGELILNDLVTRLEREQQTAILYVLPLNFAVVNADPGAKDNYERLENWLVHFAANRTPSRVRVVARTLTRDQPDLKFYDTSHLTEGAQFTDWLKKEIQADAAGH